MSQHLVKSVKTAVKTTTVCIALYGTTNFIGYLTGYDTVWAAIIASGGLSTFGAVAYKIRDFRRSKGDGATLGLGMPASEQAESWQVKR